MLQPWMHILASQRIVLASGSPRRKVILENIGLKFEVVPSTCEENLPKEDYEHPYQYAQATAMLKGMEVAQKLMKEENRPDLVIAADTVLFMDGKIFEKPKTKEHAFELLSGFSGGSHTVCSGVVLFTPTKDGKVNEDGNPFDIVKFYETTLVNFTTVDAETIRAYIETGDPMDKAGGYGIQSIGGTLIEGINGDYFNVMGFPVHKFAMNLIKIMKDKQLS